jgi:alpha-D-ribose 1-methylphosphonate 5-triphosphate synthase subunit PhnH
VNIPANSTPANSTPANSAPAASASAVQGFTDGVIDSQRIFRALMNAMANPGRVQPVTPVSRPPSPLAPLMADLALTLCDFETTLWLDPLLDIEPVRAYLRFETGVRLVADPQDAAFALIGDAMAMPPFSAFAQGTADYPDRSTTLIVAVDVLDSQGWTFTGPGVRETVSFRPAPLPDAFAGWLDGNRAQFPLGVDCVFVAPNSLAALPRSSQIREA